MRSWFRYFVFVPKEDGTKDRGGFAWGSSAEDARDRFIRTRRRPSVGQLRYKIPVVAVRESDDALDGRFFMYGPEDEGFPIKMSVGASFVNSVVETFS